MKGTKVLTCNCKHTFQDKEYGTKKRLHNLAPKGHQGQVGWRCTVCSSVKVARGNE